MSRNSSRKSEYLEHYIKHKISPVRQDISDIKSHFLRRTALYRTLGLLPASFIGKKVLEVGPGSGYNSIVTAQWNPSRYVLVEPNPRGVLHMSSLFKEQHIKDAKIEIVNTTIEEFSTNEQYDIVLCEGMIPGMRNKEEILTKLDLLLKEGGVLVLTCVDEISIFFEIIRYFIAHKLTKDIENFSKKVQIAVEAFGSHLDTLEGFCRFKEDWCADCLFGFVHFNFDFSLKKCIEFFEYNYYVYHTSSPNIFSDYRWYKVLPHTPKEFNQYYIEQFDVKKHNLLHYQVITPNRTKEENEKLLYLCRQTMSTIYEIVKFDETEKEKNIVDILGLMLKNLVNTDIKIINAIREIQEIIKKNDYIVEPISSKYKSFIPAFGRGQQYISLYKSKNP
ncbi:MAG: class I SAM-dependent methyltransferase [Nanoarchaeota archaeon]|nr:class I SAM-dependent methyltransferase [Nanoarchaeota archaeon]